MAVGGDKVADFTDDNYAVFMLKQPLRETCSVPDPTDHDCFSTLEFLSTRFSCPSPAALVQVRIAFNNQILSLLLSFRMPFKT